MLALLLQPAAQEPLKVGGRFSRKAARPSFASSVVMV
jgi:hypothetical protein